MAAFGPPQLAGQASQPNSFKPLRPVAPRLTSIAQTAVQGHPNWAYHAPVTGGTGAPAPGGTGALAPPHPVTAPAPAAPQPSGLDSTYYQQLANATLAANNRINSYNQQSGYAGTDLQNALSQLNYQQGLQTQNVENAENSRGGFALGHLGQTIGQLNHAYLDRQSADQQTYARQQAARDAAVSAVRQGLSLEQAALAAAAADRASQAAAKNPAIGQSSAPLGGSGNPDPADAIHGSSPALNGLASAIKGGPPLSGSRSQPNSHRSIARRPVTGGSGGNFTRGLGRPPRGKGTVSGGG